VRVNEHHLVPRSRKNRNKELFESDDNTIMVHEICHNAIHAVLSETELVQYYHTVERLVDHPELDKFISWVKKKPIDFYVKTKKRKK
jgi:hypothetical protein